MPTTTLPGGIKVYVAQSADKTEISPVYDADSPRGDYPVVRGVVRGTSAGASEKRKRMERVKTPKIREKSSRNLVSQPRTEDEGELRIAQRYRVSDEREKYIDHVKKLLQEAETCVQELTHKIDYYKFQADLLKDKNVEYYKRTHKAEMTLARTSRERDEARDQLKKAKLEKDRFVSEDYRGRQVIHKMREDMARQKKERKALEHNNKALKDENRRCEERVNFAENEMSKMSEMIRQMGMESDKRVKRVQMEKESMEQEKKLVELSKKRLQEKMERKVGEVHKIVRAREKEIDMLLVKIKAQANVITQLQGHLDSKKGEGRAPTTPAEKSKKRIGQT
uniref:Uncharacterized protein n=1 Tax=Branchiostoma floridae TaxID=7739 RepID=C3ZNM4_BRAFL|eukprot:XP_002589865.1 hypothetical protein BRAFLDRAFT_100693 [Branchiostoma floridae]